MSVGNLAGYFAVRKADYAEDFSLNRVYTGLYESGAVEGDLNGNEICDRSDVSSVR